MDPNYNFDNDQSTDVDVTTMGNAPETTFAGSEGVSTPVTRTVDIRESDIRAMQNAGWNRERIAQHYNVAKTDIYRVMVEFGMVKERTNEKLPTYVINPIRDCAFLA